MARILTCFVCLLSASHPITAQEDLPPLSYRTWTSARGETIDAAFIDLNRSQVILKTRDNERLSIGLDRLEWSDQVVARRLAGRSATNAASDEDRAAKRGRETAEAEVIAAFGPDSESLLLDAIQDAQHEILVAIYTMTSLPITEALQEAAQRDIRIHVKYDKGQIDVGRMSDIMETFEEEPNITVTPIEMSGRFASMHHKFAVIDQAAVFTGSFNFTVTAATQSYENAVLIYSDSIAEKYSAEFDAIESR